MQSDLFLCAQILNNIEWQTRNVRINDIGTAIVCFVVLPVVSILVQNMSHSSSLFMEGYFVYLLYSKRTVSLTSLLWPCKK
jgi:hypothetical protein